MHLEQTGDLTHGLFAKTKKIIRRNQVQNVYIVVSRYCYTSLTSFKMANSNYLYTWS